MKNHRFVFVSAISGNVLEYYDFTVYAVFSPIIARTFFPEVSEYLQILLSLTVFAVGFITRPVGGIFFGYIGDRYGRRISLIFSMLGMTIATIVIGIIPSYQDIGSYAPFILIIMRLLQGLCISGEGAGTAIFILEHYQNFRPGFTGGLVHGSNIAGTLIASIVGIIIEQYFSHIDSAWRFAFILGGFMGLIGFYLRLRVSETPIFKMLAEKQKNLNSSFISVIRDAKYPMFITFCVGAVASSVLYLIKTYVNIFYQNVLNFDNTTALIYLTYTSFIAMIAMPFFGNISDIIGKLKTIVLASIAILILALPTLLLMSSTLWWQQLFALTILGILGGAISGTAYVFIISLFTPAQRFSGIGFSYNLGIALFGGTSPVISRWLVEKTSLFYAPAFYIMLTSSIFLLVIYLMRNLINQLINK